MENLKHSHDSFDPEQNNRSQENNNDQEKQQIDVEKLWDSAKKNASSKITYVKSSKINVTEGFYKDLTEMFFGFAFATDMNLSQEESNYIRSKMLELGYSGTKFDNTWEKIHTVFTDSLGDVDKLKKINIQIFEYAGGIGNWLDDNPQSNYSKQDVVDTLVELANIDGNVDEVEQVIIDILNKNWSLSKKGPANKHTANSKEKLKPKPVKKQVKSKKSSSIARDDGKEIKRSSIINTEENYNKIQKDPKQLVKGKSKRTVTGILAIFFGFIGIHKFVLGYTKEGLIMLLVTILTFGIGTPLIAIVGFIEGVIYLTKSEDEFYNTYQTGKKKWF